MPEKRTIIKYEPTKKRFKFNIGLVGDINNWDFYYFSKAMENIRVVNDSQVIKAQELKSRYSIFDLIVFFNIENIPISTIKEISKNTRTWFWTSFWYPQLKKNKNMIEYSKYCHYRSTTGEYNSLFLQKEIILPVYQILGGSDLNEFKKLDFSKDIDVSFIGERNRETQFIKNFLNNNYKIEFMGPGFTDPITPNKFSEICSRSRIMLNIPPGFTEGYTTNTLWYYFSCESTVLTKYIPNIWKSLKIKIGKHLDDFDNLTDLKIKINFYLENEEKRNQYSYQARRHIRKFRSWTQTCLDIINIFYTQPSYYLEIL